MHDLTLDPHAYDYLTNAGMRPSYCTRGGVETPYISPDALYVCDRCEQTFVHEGSPKDKPTRCIACKLYGKKYDE